MQQLAEIMVQNTWLVGLVAVIITLGLTALLRIKGRTVSAKRQRAWGQFAACALLAIATEYLRAKGAGEAFSVQLAITWATANVGASLLIYRSGKRAWETFVGWLSGVDDDDLADDAGA